MLPKGQLGREGIRRLTEWGICARICASFTQGALLHLPNAFTWKNYFPRCCKVWDQLLSQLKTFACISSTCQRPQSSYTWISHRELQIYLFKTILCPLYKIVSPLYSSVRERCHFVPVSKSVASLPLPLLAYLISN